MYIRGVEKQDDFVIFSLAKGCQCQGGMDASAAKGSIASASASGKLVAWIDAIDSLASVINSIDAYVTYLLAQGQECACLETGFFKKEKGDETQTAMMPDVYGLASQPKFDCVEYVKPLGEPCPNGETCYDSYAECLLACGCDCAGDCPSSSSTCGNEVGCRFAGMSISGLGFIQDYGFSSFESNELSALSIAIVPVWAGQCPSMEDMPDCSKRGGYVVKGPTKPAPGSTISLGGELDYVTNDCGKVAGTHTADLSYPMKNCPRIDCVQSEDPNNPGESGGGGTLNSSYYTGFEIIDNRSAGGCSGPRECGDPLPIFCDCWPLGRGPNDPSSSTSGTIVTDPNGGGTMTDVDPVPGGGGEMAGSKDTRLRIYCPGDPEGLDCLATCSPSSTSGDGDSGGNGGNGGNGGGNSSSTASSENLNDAYWCVRERPGALELPASLLSPTSPDLDPDNWKFLSPFFAYGPTSSGNMIDMGKTEVGLPVDEMFPLANPDDVKWYVEASELNESDPGDGFVVSVADPCPSYNDNNTGPCSPGPEKRYRLSAFRGSYTENQSRFRNTPVYPGAPFMPWWRGNYAATGYHEMFANAFIQARWEQRPDEKVPGTPAIFPNLRDGGSRTESGEFCAKGGDTAPDAWYGETGLLPTWVEITGGPYYVSKGSYPTEECGSCGGPGVTSGSSSMSSGGQSSSMSSGGQSSSMSSGGQSSSGSSCPPISIPICQCGYGIHFDSQGCAILNCLQCDGNGTGTETSSGTSSEWFFCAKPKTAMSALTDPDLSTLAPDYPYLTTSSFAGVSELASVSSSSGTTLEPSNPYGGYTVCVSLPELSAGSFDIVSGPYQGLQNCAYECSEKSSSGSSSVLTTSSSSSFLYDPNKLVLVYDTSKEPANNTVSLPIAGTANATVDWGDGTTSSYSTTGFKSHTYTQPGVYTVQVSGTMTSLDHGTGASTTSNKLKLVRCLSFGNIGLTSMLRGFRGCANLAEVPSSLPSAVTNASEMFRDCALFNSANVSSWNTTALQNTSGMFVNCTSFNRDLSSWNVSNVTNMANMFYNCPAFTSNLAAWNTGRVTSMSNMFYGASLYNSNMGGWQLSGLNVNTGLDNFMSSSDALSTTNYDATLVGWNSNKASFRNDLRPNFGGSKYSCGSPAATARAALVAYGWTITDGGCV